MNEEGLIGDAADIFSMEEGDLLPLERFAEISAKKLVQSIQSRKKIALEKFIFALGIPHVGEESAIDLAKILTAKEKINSPIDLAKAAGKFRESDWETIRDIGPVVAETLYEWFNGKTNIAFLKKLTDAGVKIIPPKMPAKAAKLAGLTFVLTGELKTMNRGEAKEKIRGLGGEISESVSKKTSYLIAGENPGSKYKNAEKLNVKILNKEEFLKLVK